MTLTWVDQLGRDVPPLLASIIVAAGVVLALSFFLVRPEDRTRVAVLVLGVAVIGAVAGFAGGTSRTGVVGEVIPAALALLGGGLAVYLFGVDLSKGTLASVCAGAFALALGLGYTMGAGTRGPSERYATWTEACRDVFMAHETLASDPATNRAIRFFGEPCKELLASDLARLFNPTDTEGAKRRMATELQRLGDEFAVYQRQ